MRLVFDLESNGLYFDVTTIHCIVAKDADTGTIYKFRPAEVEQGVKLLMQADEIIGHNIINYDIPTIQKFYPWFHVDWSKVTDTLVLSRLLYADMGDKDDVAKKVPPKLRGSHSLKAWGYRLGFNKLEFDEWEHFSEEMLEYNVIDVEVTHRLYNKLKPKADKFPTAVELEHSVAWICAEQERTGFGFNVKKAHELNAKLMAERAELEGELQKAFPPFYLPDGKEYTPKAKASYPDKIPTENGYYTGEVIEVSLTDKKGNLRTIKRKVYQGYPAQKVKLTIFNPGSRHHIAHRLIRVRGWKPSEFTPNGQPKIDETILSALPWPEAKLLARYFLIQKRLSMLSEGDGAWLNFVRNGRIHGGINTNGAVTGRATHNNPNLAQVPSVGAVYGAECRELFEPGKGKVQVGVDVSGLELRMLAHYLARYDGGSYGKIVCEGDVHWTTVQAVGLTDEERDEDRFRIHKLFRNAMKTFILTRMLHQ